MKTGTAQTRRFGTSLPLMAMLLLGLVLLPLGSRTTADYDRNFTGSELATEETVASAEWDYEALPSDFDLLAGLMGYADAWHMIYGPELEARRADAESPPLLEAVVNPHAPPNTFDHSLYVPLIQREESEQMVERRAIWISRYDWTNGRLAPTPQSLDAMVEKIAAAGFNTIFFQVRAAGDAYYAPGLEPWASRLTGSVYDTLGQDPGWDPLARMISLGQATGIEVHAWVNVYPAWLPVVEDLDKRAPPATTPPHMFDRFTYGPDYAAHPGEYGLQYRWRQYDVNGHMPLTRGAYLWATPGHDQVNAYVAAVIRDIVERYPVDGIHLDYVRYAGKGYSYDPASNDAAGATKTEARDQWQRDRITALVRQVTLETESQRPGTLVSAAVWPVYLDKWGWPRMSGYSDYYQDSQGWLINDAISAIVPMLYGYTVDDRGNTGNPDARTRWTILMQDFVVNSGGRPVYPGIGTDYADFSEIAWRIETARAAGAQGHALFSYGALNSQNYWEDLRTGPYRIPAILP
jgi:uncharacterized lipoprotein YddW (UPF0748 family)